MSCVFNPGIGDWFDESGNPCNPGTGVHLSEYCRNPANLYTQPCASNPSYSPNGGGGGVIQPGGTTILSPSTVWTGQGVYSRTLQSILSGLALLRGQPNVPTAVQGVQQTQQGFLGGGYGGAGGYGNQLAGGSPGTNFSGQFQALIERHPGYVAIALAITGAFAIGALKPKRAGVR